MENGITGRKQSAGFRRYPERTTTCNITTLAASTKLITWWTQVIPCESQEAELTKEQAICRRLSYGISTCLRMMGNIYFAQRNRHFGLLPTITGAYTHRRSSPEQDIFDIYWNISMLQQNLKQYRSSLRWNAERNQMPRLQTNKYACILRKCTFIRARQEEIQKAIIRNV